MLLIANNCGQLPIDGMLIRQASAKKEGLPMVFKTKIDSLVQQGLSRRKGWFL